MRLVIRTSTAENNEKRPTGRDMAKSLDVRPCRPERVLGGSIRTAGSKGRHNNYGGGSVLNMARKIHSTEARPTVCSIARGLGARQWPMKKWAMVPTLSTSTIRGLVLVPTMIMMQRFDAVALLLRQVQKDAFGWIGQRKNGVNLDEAG